MRISRRKALPERIPPMVSPIKSLFGRRSTGGAMASLPSQANPGTLIRHLLLGADARIGALLLLTL